MAPTIELGLDTFGDATVDAEGKPLSQAQAIRDVVKQGELADQVGLAFIGVGEHHRPDFSVSAPEVVLAAIAARTTRIHLGSAVTVLSTDDPVRVFERFSTLNAISNGRAEIIVGRGSFTESYSLFGHDMANYEELFEENLSLFAGLLEAGPGDVEGAPPRTAERRARVSAVRRDVVYMGRCRRDSAVRRPGRLLRSAVDAGDHRRKPGTLRAACQAVS